MHTHSLSYRTYYDRPPVGSLNRYTSCWTAFSAIMLFMIVLIVLHRMYSPALTSYFPSPKETYSWAFEPPYKPSTR